jgi:hypothetical protein
MRRFLILAIALLCAIPLAAQTYVATNGFCETGGKTVLTQGMASTTKVQQSYPGCSVTVWVHGSYLATKATLYSTDSGTSLANPFTANSDGSWQYYAAAGRYDIQMSGGGISGSFTRYDVSPAPAPIPALPIVTSNSVFNVLNYGADNTGATDAGTAIYNASVALQAAGGGTLYFPPGTYKVWSVGQTYPMTSCSGSSSQAIMPFCNLNGVTVISNGATLAMDPANTDMSAGQIYAAYVSFVNCTNVKVDGFHITGPAVDTVYGRFNYPVFVGAYLTTNIDMPNNWVQGVLQGFSTSSGAYPDDYSYHSKSIHIGNLFVKDSYYGVNLQNSGDFCVIDNLYVDAVDRALFPYGVRGLKARVYSANSSAVILLMYAGYYATIPTEDVDLDLVEIGNTTVNPYIPVQITFGYAHPSVFRNIKIKVHLNPNAALSGQAESIYISKLETGSDHGHIMDGLDISGSIDGVVKGSPFHGMIYMDPGTTWGTGDFWYNVNIHDLYINSGSAESSSFNLGSLGTSGITFTNVYSDGDITLTGLPTGSRLSIIGSSIPNYPIGANIINSTMTISGTTSAISTGTTVTHGLGATPSEVLLTASDTGVSNIYVSAIGGTTFTVNYAGGGTHIFYWTAIK